jgi:hypothetical protein
MKVFLVQAAQGDYERSWWPVDVWQSLRLAEKRAARLTWCARKLRDALRDDPMPEQEAVEATAADIAAYDAWTARRNALIAKWRDLAGDELLDGYDEPTYTVVPLTMRTKASRS